MASRSRRNYDSNSDNDDLLLIEETKSRKRKSITLLQDNFEEDDDFLDKPFNSTKRKSLIAADLKTKNKKQNLNKLAWKQFLSERIDRLCEYTQVLMHCLLFKINYYNKKTHFEKYLKYNTIVYKCKSEIVCEYITNCIECMRLIMYEKYNIKHSSDEHDDDFDIKDDSVFSIGMAILNSSKKNNSDDTSLIKRYTLQIENLSSGIDMTDPFTFNKDYDIEWEFRESLLKCLYSKDFVQNWTNFKWQIQLRTKKSNIKHLSEQDDLFKIFAWRECEKSEITSITTSNNEQTTNNISIQPIKTMKNTAGSLFKIQMFIEQPVIVSFKSKSK